MGSTLRSAMSTISFCITFPPARLSITMSSETESVLPTTRQTMRATEPPVTG